MHISDNWGELLLPGLRTIFDKHLKKGKDFLSVIYNTENSTKAQEFNLGVGELGEMVEWDASGRQVSYETFNKGFKATYTHKKYSKGVEVERELVDDDLYGEIKKRVRKLSRVVYYTTQSHAVLPFNNAFGGILGPDAKPLCSATHPIMPGSATVWSNAGTWILSAKRVEDTRNLMKQWVDDKGNLLMIDPDTIIVPVSLRKTAQIIAETANEPFTTDYGVNVWKGNLNVIEWPFLTDQNTWFLVDMQRMKDYLNWYWRRRPDFADKVDFDTEVAKYKVIGRWSYGWDDASFLYGHTGTVA